jgi:hypothetical protein
LEKQVPSETLHWALVLSVAYPISSVGHFFLLSTNFCQFVAYHLFELKNLEGSCSYKVQKVINFIMLEK